MKLTGRPALLSLILPFAIAVLLAAPAVILAANNGDISGVLSSFGLDPTPVTMAAGDGPVFSSPAPAIATNDQYAPISIEFSDPDGINRYATQLWFDSEEVTKCPSYAGAWVYFREDGVTWNHFWPVFQDPANPSCRKILDREKKAMADGPHSVAVTAYDLLGNSSTYIWTIYVDHNPPVITPWALCGATIDTNTPNIEFGYDDMSGIDTASVAMYIDNVQAPAEAGAASVQYTSAPLAEGRHDIRLNIRDNGGNPASEECYFIIDTQPPVITGTYPANGSKFGAPDPIIRVNWRDDGAGIDQYLAYLEVDGVDVSPQAAVDQYGMSYQASGLTLGGHTALARIHDRTGKVAEEAWTFTRVEPVTYYAPWYDSNPYNGIGGNWVLISNLEDTDAAVDVYIGNERMMPKPEEADASGQHFLVKGKDEITPQFPGQTNGPVRIVSTTADELLVSQRVIYGRSFNEVVALREDELDSDYRFTWYDFKPQNGMGGNWILIGNVDQTNATVDVYIGPNHMGTWEVPPNGIITPGGGDTPQFFNLMDGPVRVTSRGGQKLIVSQRVVYKGSFSEVIGTPVKQLDDEYYFTWYDWQSPGMNGDWVLVGNESGSAAAEVYIEIAGQRMKDPDNPGSDTFLIPPGGRVTPIFVGVMDGPVHVGCENCEADGIKIMASQRVIYKNSFEEVQGLSPELMGTSAVFTWYDWLSPEMMGNWIMVGNNSSLPASVSIAIDGNPMKNAAAGNYGFGVGAMDNVTPSFKNLMEGPVLVECNSCAGQKLIISQRVLYLDSFNEVTGRPPRVP